MSADGDEDTMQNLIEVKTELMKSLSELNDDKNILKQKLKSIKDKKDKLRKMKASELQRVYKLRLAFSDIDANLSAEMNHIKKSNEKLGQLELGVLDAMRLKDFEKEVMEICSSMEGAINFYSEDSLNIEYMKRNKLANDKRIEFTKLEDEIKQMKERIETERLEKIRQQKIQEERRKQELEDLRRQEEEKAQLDRERQRDQFRAQQAIGESARVLTESNIPNQSFRAERAPTVPGDFIRPTDNTSYTSSNDKVPSKKVNTSFESSANSFSQLFQDW